MKTYNGQRGQTIVLFTVAFVPMVALMGLVVDVGWAYFRRQAAQAAADSAAVAAVMAVNASSGSSIACGTNGAVCQADTTCPTSISSPPTNDFQVACLYASGNGFAQGGSQTVTFAADKTSPPPAVPGVAVKYWVTVRVGERENQTFSSILGNTLLNTGAHATAAIFQPNPSTCVYVLAPAQAGAISANGTTNVQTGCNIWVNSTNSDAVDMVGGAQITVSNGASVNIVGNWSGKGGAAISPSPNTGASTVSDPFAGMPTPAVGSCINSGISLTGGTTTIGPGTYCGAINLTGQANLVLTPGTYVLKNGLSMAGGTSISGSGVTLYLQGGGITMAGGANVNLSAPGSGPYQGIVIYQDRSDSTADSLVGGATQLISGTIYLPAANVSYSGGSGTQAATATLVCYTVSFVGNSTFLQGASSKYVSGAVGPTLID
ncbi:MAG TPA: pilus assembly protein TadG-related protein [Bryobacteraceae bacterium]|nr:pilus assembly protein TadG-related protein [Bryobacteraceae bacterium]